jgi:hypothetical protein
MSKLITIPAEGLKWCPVGFSFYREEHPNTEFAMKQVSYGQVFADCWPDYLGSMSSDVGVQVNAKDYERVCIERIKEMFEKKHVRIIKITKHGGLIHCHMQILPVVIEDKGKQKITEPMDLYFPINCDPRPNIDEYTIEVNND